MAVGATGESPADLRYERLDRKIGEALVALASAQEALRRLEAGVRSARDDFRSGVRLRDWPRGETVDAWIGFQDLFVGLQSALRDVRTEAYRAAAAVDGMSFSEIASVTERTRQVVTRLVKSGEEDVLDEGGNG